MKSRCYLLYRKPNVIHASDLDCKVPNCICSWQKSLFFKSRPKYNASEMHELLYTLNPDFILCWVRLYECFLQMSYAASAPTLSNRMDYPYFYRTIMPDTMFNPARIRLMKEFKWSKVGTIHGKHEIFSLVRFYL